MIEHFAAGSSNSAAVLGFDWDSTLRNVVVGSAILGMVGGVLGSFATLRKQSLLGDTLAHAALPGVCIAFMITGSRESLPLLIGAGLSGLIGTLIFLLITSRSRIKEDAALGIVLSVGFGLGILLLTRIQHSGNSGQAGLDRFLFGQAASLVTSDVITMGVLGVGALLTVALLFKQFKLITFDPDYATSLGLPTPLLTVVLTALMIVAVVIGLQAVGVILIVAILIAPAAAARQWTDRLSTMVMLAGVLGAVAGVAGALLSSQIQRLPTGPAVVLVATLLTGISLLFAPKRGIVWGAIERRRRQARLRELASLRDVGGFLEPRLDAGITPAAFAAHIGSTEAVAASTLGQMRRRGLVSSAGGTWQLTDAGQVAARQALHQERVWRRFMARQMEIGVEHVHLDMSEIERVLPPEVLRQIEAEVAADEGAPRTVESGSAGWRDTRRALGNAEQTP